MKCLQCGAEDSVIDESNMEEEFNAYFNQLPEEIRKIMSKLFDYLLQYQGITLLIKFKICKNIYELFVNSKDISNIIDGINAYIIAKCYKDPRKREHYLFAIIRNKLNESKIQFEYEQQRLNAIPPE